MADLLECPCCSQIFSFEKIAQQHFRCEKCSEEIQTIFYPALVQPSSHSQITPILGSSSTCFFHPQKSAKSICESCGIFVCALCETESHQKIYCVKCLEKGITKEKDPTFVQSSILYDGIAWGLALAPFTLFFTILTPISALAVIVLFLFYRKKSKSILPRTPWRWICALLLAFTQIGGILYLFFWKP